MFKNRLDAGNQLADEIAKISTKNAIVVALPRGGVPIGELVADRIKAPLEIVVPRKIGHPSHEEFAIGALVEEGEVIWSESDKKGLPEEELDKIVKSEREEAQRRRKLYGLGKPRQSFKDKEVILVDDGIATGLTMLAAISTIKADKPKKITVAIPVSPEDSLKKIEKEVDSTICLEVPKFFMAIGGHYKDFSQVSDEEVIKIMKKYQV